MVLGISGSWVALHNNTGTEAETQLTLSRETRPDPLDGSNFKGADLRYANELGSGGGP